MSPALRQSCDAARGLMERVLRAGAPIAAEYPLVFAGSRHAAFVIDEADGEARSTCALLERELLVRGRKLHAGLIGSVATDPRWRGQGHGASVLAEAEQELARRGALLAILWADDTDYYEKRGWRRFGWEIDFEIPSDCAASMPEPFGVRERRPEDDGQLHELYERHPERIARSAEETSALLSCPDMEVLVVERWGRVAGYSCLGRGADMRNVVHEWAGDAQALLTLLREHFARRRDRGVEESLFLIAPPSAVDVAERLEKVGAQMSEGVVGMAKILRPQEAGSLCAELFDRRAGVHCTAAHEDGTVEFTGPKGKVSCTREVLFDLLFAPLADRALVEQVGGKLGVPGIELPLTPFVWGLDSI
ncbi:MAG: GNAT family N-acetyltransferase [Planctomycetes bacterium]|nr:GNAT family N-acetyltransferase [Planctomycetota bacterium]